MGMTPSNFVLSPHSFAAAEACPAARVYRGPKQPTSQANWHGIFVHLFLQYAKERGREYALAYVKRKFKNRLSFAEKIDLDQIPDGIPEPQFIIDTAKRTADQVHKGEERGLANARDHVTVRGDMLAHTPNALPWVIDYKSGVDNTTEPSTSVQSMIEATAVYALDAVKKPPGVRASVFNIISGEIRQRHHVFSADELEANLTRIRRVHLSVLETRAELKQEGIEPEQIPGPYCRWCNARTVCPSAGNDV